MPSRTSFRKIFSSSSRDSINRKQDIAQLIERQKWKKIRQLLSDNENEESAAQPTTSTIPTPTPAEILSSFPEEAAQQTALHLLCSKNPPVDIVRRFIELMPHHPYEMDVLEQTPLHTAAAFDAQLDVIDHLISVYPEAASAKDADGKTPLIIACETTYSCFAFADFIDDDTKEWSFDVIMALVVAAPRAVADEDCAGMSALEYAISNGAPANIVKLLQSACRAEGRRKQQDQQREAVRRVRRESEMGQTTNTHRTSPSSSTCGKEMTEFSFQWMVGNVPPVINATQGDAWIRRISGLSC